MPVPVAAPARPLVVALAGNPNTGKTTVFNALTGYRARVGNYAGVTVERKTGPLKGATPDRPARIVDLPGTYSLSARSADEMVATDVLLGIRRDEDRPDLVLVVLDASNLERNLFLATQVMECGVPCALVLNMMDVARESGLKIDTQGLARRLGVPVFPCSASRGEGIPALREWVLSAERPEAATAAITFPEPFQAAAERLRGELIAAGVPEELARPFLVRRSMLESGGMAERRFVDLGGDEAARAIDTARAHLAEAGFRPLTLEAKVRYGFIQKTLEGVLERPADRIETYSDRLDRILIHKVWGTLIFAALMLIVFQAIYSWSAPFMDAIEGAFTALGGLIASVMAAGPLRSFLVDGVIAGVGGVIVFLPQILFLFFFISILEDCGYMARAAFLMDRLLSKAGLSGRSFIPLLSSFACAIPGIMATRTIEDRRDRLTTILVAPLMSCSARLPVYTLLIGAFIPVHYFFGFLNLQGLTLFGMYLVGLAVAIPVALILKKTFFRGGAPSFIMELPPYRMPNWKTVYHRLIERAGAFLRRAGTVIFAVAIVVWAMTYYPRPASVREEIEARLASQAAAGSPEERALAEESLERAVEGAYLRQSILGRLGRTIEPAVEPLGWDWKIGMAVVASFPAREVVIATLGIIYDLGSDADEESADLREKLQTARRADGSPAFSLPVALSLMVFFALCAQCAATLAVIRRETNSWRWPIFSFVYMTVLAWIGAFLTYHLALILLGGGP